MRNAFVAVCALTLALATAPCAHAQDAPKPIGPFVIDIRGTIPRFPSDNEGLAESRGLVSEELPGSGFGVDVGAYVYPLRWKAVTFGLGGQLTHGTSHSGGDPQSGLSAVSERFTAIAPQLSFNFGTAAGWSYLSAGAGTAVWSIVPNGSSPLPADDQRLTAYNYGGGARWFAKKHLAFNFDVRFWDIYPGVSVFGFPASPRVKMMVLGAGISLR
jgi:hypothetical protein